MVHHQTKNHMDLVFLTNAFRLERYLTVEFSLQETMKRIKLLGLRMFTTETVGQDQGPKKVAVKQTLELRQIETSLKCLVR